MAKRWVMLGVIVALLAAAGAGVWLHVSANQTEEYSGGWSPSGGHQPVVADGQQPPGEAGTIAPAPPPLPFQANAEAANGESEPSPMSDEELVREFAVASRERGSQRAKELGKEIVERGAGCLAVARKHFEGMPVDDGRDALSGASPEMRERQGFAFVLAHLPEAEVKAMTIDFLKSVWIDRKSLDELRKAKYFSRDAADLPWAAMPSADTARMDMLCWHIRIREQVPAWVPLAIESVVWPEAADLWASAMYQHAAAIPILKEGLERTAPYVLSGRHFRDSVKRQVRELYVKPPRTAFELADQMVQAANEIEVLQQVVRKMLKDGAMQPAEMAAGIAMAGERVGLKDAESIGMSAGGEIGQYFHDKYFDGSGKDRKPANRETIEELEKFLRAFAQELKARVASNGSTVALMQVFSSIVVSVVDDTGTHEAVRRSGAIALDLSAAEVAAMTKPDAEMLAKAKAGDDNGALMARYGACAALVGLSTGDADEMARRIAGLWERWDTLPASAESARVFLLQALRIQLGTEALKRSPAATARMVEAALVPGISQQGMDHAAWKRHTGGTANFVLTTMLKILAEAGNPALGQPALARIGELFALVVETEEARQKHGKTLGHMELADLKKALREGGYLPAEPEGR